MQLTFHSVGAVQVLAINGRIDQNNASALEVALAPYLQFCTQDGKRVVLDFAGVDYISSVGLRVLMLAAKQVKKQQGRLVIASLSPIVDEVFKVSRFDMILQVHATVAQAVAEVSA